MNFFCLPVLFLIGVLALTGCQTASNAAKTTDAAKDIIEVNGLALASIEDLRLLAIASAKLAGAAELCSLPHQTLDKRIAATSALLPPHPNLDKGWFETDYRSERKRMEKPLSASCDAAGDRPRIARMLTRLQEDLASSVFSAWLSRQIKKKDPHARLS